MTCRSCNNIVKTPDHGSEVIFEGVLLADVLAKADVPGGERLRGKGLSLHLLVEASDSYRAVFALPELDPTFTDRKIYLTSRRNGGALPEGPLRIVVPDERSATRRVRHVVALQIRQAN